MAENAEKTEKPGKKGRPKGSHKAVKQESIEGKIREAMVYLTDPEKKKILEQIRKIIKNNMKNILE